MGALQTSAGGVSQAFGVQASAITDVVGAGADIAKSLGTGGPMLAALTAATAGVAILIEKFDLFGTRAAEAAAKARKALDDLDEKAAGIRLGTAAKLAGESPELLGQRRSVERAQQDVGMAKLRASEVGGGAYSLQLLQEMSKAGGWMPAGGKEAVEKFVKASAALAAQQNLLASMIEDSGVDKSLEDQDKAINDANEQERKYQEALKEAAERLLSLEYASVIRRLDSVKAAADVDAELSANTYTAEDRATREDRGVFEVSKGQFDANLAGVDLEKADAAIQEVLDKLGSAFSAPADVIELAFVDAVDATTSDIDEMNRQFLAAGESANALAEGALDLRDPLEQFGDALSSGIDSLGGAAGIATTAIEGGASGVGQALGGVAGGVIGTAVAGPAGTGIGSALGSMLGGLLGDSLDKLIESLGVLTPLFDAIGVIIGALQPVLVVLGGLFVTIGDAIVSLVPIIIILARLFGSNVAIFVRLLQVVLMVVPLISLLASVILVWVDGLVSVFGWIDEMFLTPLADSVIQFVNVVIMAYNGIIDFIRKIPGFEDFGTKAEYMKRDESAFVGVGDMINDVKEAAALGAEEGATGGGGTNGEGGTGGGGAGEETKTEDSWGQDLANVPSGFKAMAAIYASADAESGAGMFTPRQVMEMTIHIENWNSKGDSQRDWEDLRRLARNGHKGKKAQSPKGYGDEKN
jgi:hypothetical protein